MKLSPQEERARCDIFLASWWRVGYNYSKNFFYGKNFYFFYFVLFTFYLEKSFLLSSTEEIIENFLYANPYLYYLETFISFCLSGLKFLHILGNLMKIKMFIYYAS